MITPQLIDYVRAQLANGAVHEDVRRTLLAHGWTAQDITEALAAGAPGAPAVPEAPERAPGAARSLVLSFAFIIASAVYAGWLDTTGAQQPTAAATLATAAPAQAQPQPAAPAQAQPQPAAPAQTAPAAKQPAPAQQPSQPAPAQQPSQPAPAAASGLYKNGTYTGQAADAYYGLVQVRTTVQGGQMANVQFLQYPNTHSTSVYINSQAMPMLVQEALQAQSAQVNIISGATDTSIAFRQSLASALAQATP